MRLLCTPEQARPPHLAEGVDSDVLSGLCEVASATIAKVCGYPSPSFGVAPSIYSTSYTLDLDGPGGRDLPLPIWPVSSVTEINDDTGQDFDSDTIVDPDDYELRLLPAGWCVRLLSTASVSSWSRGSAVVRVTFVAGYTSAPAALVQVAIDLVRHLYEQRSQTRVESASVSGASYTLTAPSGMPDWLRHRLALAGAILPRAVV